MSLDEMSEFELNFASVKPENNSETEREDFIKKHLPSNHKISKEDIEKSRKDFIQKYSVLKSNP